MADVRITPASGSIQFTGSVAGNVLDLIYTGSALQFNTGSTNLIHISSSGFIGFGTSAPLFYNTASFVVNTDAFLAKGLTVGSPDFFNNAILRFYETDFTITANNVIQSYALNVGSTPAISINSSNGNVGIGNNNFPANARLHVSGGNAWFSDNVVVGLDNYAAGGKIQFVANTDFIYVGGDLNTNILTLKSRFGSVDITTDNDTFRVQNGILYQRFGNTFFSASADGIYYNSGLGQFSVVDTGNVNITNTTSNAVLSVTGSIQVSGSIYTNGTNIQALSIAYAIALG